MKEFRYASGKLAGKTMTVGRLKLELEKYQDHMPVFGYWEGVKAYISEHSFSIQEVDKGLKEDRCECLLIDMDDY